MKTFFQVSSLLFLTSCFSDTRPLRDPVKYSSTVPEEEIATDDLEPVVRSAPEVEMPHEEKDLFKTLSFKVSGLPSEKSDLDEFELVIEADPLVTYYSYKLGQPADCLKGEGYGITPISETRKLQIPEHLQGKIALCILKFHGPSKQWQPTPQSTIISWERIRFHRTIKARYSEFDESCGKDIDTDTEITFTEKSGTYKWKRDAKAQGCEQEMMSGEDSLSINSITKTSISGFWNWNGPETSGWFLFNWKDIERKTFAGTFGYGDPTHPAAGDWNSIP